MLLSPMFRSFDLRRSALPGDRPLESGETGSLDACRAALAPFEVPLPASVLASGPAAAWVRGHHWSVDARTVPDWDLAVRARIDPNLVTLHCTTVEPRHISQITREAVGRLAAGTLAEIDAIRPRADGRAHHLLLRICDVAGDGFTVGSTAADRATEAIVRKRYSCMVGLYCAIGWGVSDAVSVPAAIGDAIAQMEHIHHRFGVVLTRLHLGGTHLGAASEEARRRFAADIGDSLEDACAAMRFPRPDVTVSIPSGGVA